MKNIAWGAISGAFTPPFALIYDQSAWLNRRVSNSEISPQVVPKNYGSKFRKDILGLRGIAVLLVVLCHYGVPGFVEGFFGVDLFFVISGYLIVGLMYQEYVRNGKSLGGYGWISVASFFERRIRRIIPTAFFVLTFIYIATFFLDDANSKLQITRDIIWGFLFASNINFAHRQTDYFTRDALPSPVLHFWSLAVEEQFYLLMPFIFMAVVNWHGFSLAGRRFAARYRLYIFITLMTFVSFISMVLIFSYNRTPIYYSLFSRIWEFGIGALGAITLPVVAVRFKIFLYLLRRMCYVILLASLFLVSADNFGYMLLAPAAAIAIIMYVNNQLRGGFAYKVILTNRVLTFFGRISFSFYLWHWPFLIYAQYFRFSLTWIHKAAMLLVVVGLSTLTERYVERPFLRVGYISEFHVSPLLKSRRFTAVVLATVTSLLVFVTYQPVISTQLNQIQVHKQQPFWSPPASAGIMPISGTPAHAIPQAPTVTKPAQPKYLGIFGDSTNQCCSPTGAFWPRLVAQHFGWQYNDYSKPATTYLIDGVGSNGCNKAADCPSVVGQLSQAAGKQLDVVTIAAGIGDCPLAKSQPDSLQSSLTDLFRNFKSTFPNAYIVALGIITPKTVNRAECLAAVDPIVAQSAKASGISYLDGDSNWISDVKTQMTADTAHLNDLGHKVFATKFITWLQSQKDFVSKFRN